MPTEWADRYQGGFDQGWEQVREETFARQKELGVIPPDTDLTQRHAEIPAWDDMPEQLKPVLARQMEVYAGFLSYADHYVGRVIDAIEELGQLDNTLVIYIVGDNGASAEGTLNGTLNETNIANAPGAETPEYLREHIDDLGTPRAYNHGCSASIWSAPDGSSLLTLPASSVQMAPDGSRRIQTDPDGSSG